MNTPSVLIFAGSDPSAGAGLQADLLAVAAQGAHPLTVVTAVTVQDNDRVHAVYPVLADQVREQAEALLARIEVAAVKIGIPGSLKNAQAIAAVLKELKQRQPQLPVVLDPVLASGHGDRLGAGSAREAVQALLPLATLLTPNLPEAAALCEGERRLETQAERLLHSCPHVLIKGGHANSVQVVNTWFSREAQRSWTWPRLPGEFHGSGCTLAAAIAGQLAIGADLVQALEAAQDYVQRSLSAAYSIAPGQLIPRRILKGN